MICSTHYIDLNIVPHF